ncbi:MAG: hypothetical protein J6X37_04060, partial [Treponema sp.]|nr:hypothetical protein [Treponema sp.]
SEARKPLDIQATLPRAKRRFFIRFFLPLSQRIFVAFSARAFRKYCCVFSEHFFYFLLFVPIRYARKLFNRLYDNSVE